MILQANNHTSKEDKLIIIGNGFDLAHGLKTDYNSFVSYVQDPALIEFQRMCDGIPQITDWTQFEENINTIVHNYYNRMVLANVSADTASKEIAKINSVYNRINDLLKEYLRQATACSLDTIDSIEKVFNGNETVLCFNYTNTVTKYTNEDNIVYVHGSLAENDIVLGYDNPIELCLAGYEESLWNKQICRENLAFRRMLRKKGFSIKNEEYGNIADSFAEYQRWAYSGRGADDPVLKNKINYYSIIKEFLSHLDTIHSRQQFPYDQIKDVYILGHGLKSDRVYLESIFMKCNNSKRVYLYSYEGENKDAYREKKKLLKKYFGQIIDKHY